MLSSAERARILSAWKRRNALLHNSALMRETAFSHQAEANKWFKKSDVTRIAAEKEWGDAVSKSGAASWQVHQKDGHHGLKFPDGSRLIFKTKKQENKI